MAGTIANNATWKDLPLLVVVGGVLVTLALSQIATYTLRKTIAGWRSTK